MPLGQAQPLLRRWVMWVWVCGRLLFPSMCMCLCAPKRRRNLCVHIWECIHFLGGGGNMHHWFHKQIGQGFVFCLVFLFVCLFVCFLGPHPGHVEVPRLGVESELQLPAYATATPMPDPSCICSLHHSSWQPWILNPPSRAWGQTLVLVDSDQVCYCWATVGTPVFIKSWVDSKSYL